LLIAQHTQIRRLSVDGGNEIADDRLAEEHHAKHTLAALGNSYPNRKPLVHPSLS
jgi:hypothetical protein